MNVRSFIALGAVMALGLSACIFETTTSGSSGTNGSGGGVGEGGADPTGGVGSTSGSGTPACDENYTCTEAIDPASGDPTKICDGPHGDLYDAYQACVCTGACATDCSASDRCAEGGANDADCTACIQSSCKAAFDACANDA